MPHCLRRVEGGCEVHALNRHVGGKNQFLPGGDSHQGGVIANAQGKARHPPGGPATNPGNEVGFAFEKMTRRAWYTRNESGQDSHLSILA